MKGVLTGLVIIVGLTLAEGQDLSNRQIPAASQNTGDDQKPSLFDKMYFGGGMGFSGGTNSYGQRYTYIGLYPMVGYRTSEKTSIGASLTYQYYNYPDVNYSYTQYGISPFVRYNFVPQVFAYSEFMILSSPSYDPTVPRKVYNRWLFGLGVSQRLGQRSSINAMGMYDVLYKSTDQVFNSPFVFRVFFSF